MKTTKQLMLVCFAAVLCICCNTKDDNEPSTDTISKNTLSGSISNYTAGTIDSLKFVYAREDDQDNLVVSVVFGSGAIDTNGAFSVKLSTPPDSLLEGLDEMESGITVSDATVKATAGFEDYYITAYKNKSIVGFVMFANNIYNSIVLSNNGYVSSTDDGWSFCMPVYFSKDVIITGTHSSSYSNESYIYTYDITAKKGWNNLYLLNSYSESGNVGIYSEKYTTTLPGNYKWYYYPLSILSSAKRQNAKSVSKGFLK